jgi:hypothetical protein
LETLKIKWRFLIGVYFSGIFFKFLTVKFPMQKKRLLQDIGLTAYEAAAYLSLLKFGVSGASIFPGMPTCPMGRYILFSNLWQEKVL